MGNELEREQLVLLVERIQQGDGTEEEIDQWLSLVNQNVPAPTGYVSDLIFYPNLYGYTEELSSAQVVHLALDWKPIYL